MLTAKKYIILFVILIGSALPLFAGGVSHDTISEGYNEEVYNEVVYSTALLDSYIAQQSATITDGKFSPLPNTPQSILDKRDSVAAYMNQMDQSQSYADEVPEKIDKLPIGIRKVIGNLDWTLMLTNMAVGVDGAQLSAYLRVITPQGKTLYFGANAVKVNSDGGISDMQLVLLGTVDIPISGAYRLVLKGGDFSKATGTATGQFTSATIGCQGLKEINLVGTFELSRDLVIPVNPNTLNREMDDEKTVNAAFSINLKNWNDLLVNLTLPAFEMKGLDGVIFNVRNATLDMSDTRNTGNMIFPKGYREKYYAGSSTLWRGVYIEELDVVLPKQFAKRGGQRPKFSGQCMIIDQQGVSGIYSVTADLLSLNEGSASGWKFSVNYLMITLEANKLTAGGFGGKIVLPVSSKKDGSNELAYTALISDKDEYFLTIKLLNDLPFDFMMAKITLNKNSYVDMALLRETSADGKTGKQVFKPEAVLTGTISLNASNSSSGGAMKADGLRFTELRLFTDAPYIKIKEIAYDGQIGFSNFPVSLSNIACGEMQEDGKSCLYLGFNLKIEVAQGKFKGDTRIILSAYYDKPQAESTGNWKFNRLRIEQITINAEFSGLKVKGMILFLENDPDYGNGFAGSVEIDYAGKFKIASSCMFGATTFRYWYVDARLDLPTGIPVVTPFYLNGFGGGVYSRMVKAPKGSKLPYVPDESSSFGVKALVAYSIAKKEVCKGDLMFEMCFNDKGGIKYIAFYGTAEIMAGAGALGGIVSKLDAVNQSTLAATGKGNEDKIASGNIQQVANTTEVGPKPTASIFACIGIQFNFETSTLDATSEVYINLGVLKGRGPNNRAGWIEVHFGPDKWYCYAGTPEDRMGIVLNMAVMQLETGSYFMVGSEMPTFPDPPKKVVDILGPELYPAKTNINESSLKSGAGFAFGMDLGIRANMDFMILYANLEAGVGGDIMLRQYPDAHCEGSNSPLGINSWYANGRVYAYLMGEIGVKVDLMFIHARIPIINGAAAAMLEAGGPNPTWAKGYLRVKFSVLGGKVKGDMQMKMSLGDECKIVSNSQAPISFKIIADMSPAEGGSQIDVFTSPQIAFNVAVGEPFEITDDAGSKKLYRIKLSTLELSKGSTPLVFTKVWTNNQTLTLVPENTLPQESTVQLKAKAEFEIMENNNWVAYKVNGKVPVEEQVVSFKTGKAPDYIPHKNIAYMYPAHYQKNVYKNERNKGYVVLKQWQDYLLDGDKKTNKFVKLTPANGKQALVHAVIFNRGSKEIGFDISDIKSKMAYTFSLVSLPVDAGNPNVAASTTTYGTEESGQYQVTQNQAQSVVKNDGEKELLVYKFSTSTYPTLADKIYKINLGVSNKLVYFANSDYINVRTSAYEPFDSTEVFGSAYTDNKPLIAYQAALTDTYYKNVIYGAVYRDYPFSKASGIKVRERDPNEYGFPPVKAIYNDSEYDLDQRRMPYINAVIELYRKDYHDFENQLINQYVSGNTALLTVYPQFFKERFPEPPLGNIEQVEFRYVMPGNNSGSSGFINYKR